MGEAAPSSIERGLKWGQIFWAGGGVAHAKGLTSADVQRQVRAFRPTEAAVAVRVGHQMSSCPQRSLAVYQRGFRKAASVDDSGPVDR
jgi:hypothetical protein